MDILEISTGEREEMIDITTQVRALVRKSGWQSGALLLIAHTPPEQ